MSHKKRILIVTPEMDPYIEFSEAAKVIYNYPAKLHERAGMEMRVLMPRFGIINERRHRLHEVVRLSGINIIIDEDDYPLLIKVASLQGVRLQTYFLDNDEFFNRKSVFHDDDGNFYDDNTERMVFFCKGVLETVKKFGWAPDIVMCFGWMTSLLPLYGKVAYKNDPIFNKTKYIYIPFKNDYKGTLGEKFAAKAPIKELDLSQLKHYGTTSNNDMHRGGIYHSDGIVVGSPDLDPEILALIDEASAAKPVLPYMESPDYLEVYKTFFSLFDHTNE